MALSDSESRLGWARALHVPCYRGQTIPSRTQGGLLTDCLASLRSHLSGGVRDDSSVEVGRVEEGRVWKVLRPEEHEAGNIGRTGGRGQWEGWGLPAYTTERQRALRNLRPLLSVVILKNRIRSCR